jgi:hemolysin III
MIKTKLKNLSIEELANTITHGFGLVLSIAGFIFLVVLASINGDFWHIASSVVYGLSLVTLYAASTFYHSATSTELKRKLQILDHCCIYLLIAGSYTPFTLIVLHGTFGNRLFVFAWTFALVGIAMKIFFFKRFPIASVISYIVMGWVGVLAVQPLFTALGFMPIALVLAGGLAYSLGIIFFAWEKLPHNHAIWHIFVLTGSICHYLVVAIYVIPYVVNL